MINIDKYLQKHKGPPHEKAAVVNLFLDFIGGATKDYPYTFWLKKVGRCDYGQALEIVKSLENLPLKYNKAGTIINKLKELNGTRTK
jgi:hypothetical protein